MFKNCGGKNNLIVSSWLRD